MNTPDITPVTAPEIKFKTPNESIVYAAEFSRQLEDGETLDSGATATELTTSDLAITEVAISGTKVRFRVGTISGGSVTGGGIAGTDYVIIVTVLTANPANKRQLYCRLSVRAA